MYKESLVNIYEIVDYIVSFSDSDISEEFVEESLKEQFGFKVKAVLKTFPIGAIKLEKDNENSHMQSSSKQKKYNKLQTQAPPILINEEGMIIDGYHRYRAALFKEDSEILVYQIIIEE